MKIEDIVVGELVRVREWDDIAEEARENGGYEDEDSIYLKQDECYFVDPMRFLCGQVFMVEDISYVNDFGVSVHKVLLSQDGKWLEHWTITPGMIEPASDKEQVEIATEALLSILFE